MPRKSIPSISAKDLRMLLIAYGDFPSRFFDPATGKAKTREALLHQLQKYHGLTTLSKLYHITRATDVRRAKSVVQAKLALFEAEMAHQRRKKPGRYAITKHCESWDDEKDVAGFRKQLLRMWDLPGRKKLSTWHLMTPKGVVRTRIKDICAAMTIYPGKSALTQITRLGEIAVRVAALAWLGRKTYQLGTKLVTKKKIYK